MYNTNEYYTKTLDILGWEHEEALQCLTSINGWKKETIDDFIYWLTAYNDLEQLEESEV